MADYLHSEKEAPVVVSRTPIVTKDVVKSLRNCNEEDTGRAVLKIPYFLSTMRCKFCLSSSKLGVPNYFAITRAQCGIWNSGIYLYSAPSI